MCQYLCHDVTGIAPIQVRPTGSSLHGTHSEGACFLGKGFGPGKREGRCVLSYTCVEVVVVGLTTQLQSEELLEDPDVSGNLQRETGSWKPEVPLWTLACWFLEAVAWHK